MKEYDESLPFWDTMYGAQDYSDVTYSTDDLNFGCPEMVQCLSDLVQKKRILDYGCGDGWQSFALLNAGAKDITAIDPSSRACDTGASIAERRGDSGKIRFVRGTEELLEAGSSDAATESSSSPSCAGPYDGFISVNVLDVVPESVATRILNAIKASLAPEQEQGVSVTPHGCGFPAVLSLR